MSKLIFKPFWSYDIIKTELWLSHMHSKGYALYKINFIARLFYFKKVEPTAYYYKIVFEKKSNGNISDALINCGFENIYFSKNYYVIRTVTQNPPTSSSYNGFLDKNRKLKYVVGIILLCLLCLAVFPAVIFGFIVFALITGNFTVDKTPPPETLIPPSSVDIIGGIIFFLWSAIFILALIWLIYTYFKLRITNKQLEKLCGDTLNLSFTIPKESILSKAEEKALKKQKKIIRKMRIAWIYAPDKAEAWLEKMESLGYNLYRMSRLGNSFFFIKGQPRKIKYCVDYQNKANPQYFNLNKESGWKLIFTSLSRIQSLNVWSQEYTDELPLFYSDKESKLKHAKRFALTYSLCFFPLCILYIFLIIFDVFIIKNVNLMPLPNLILYLLLICEFGFFAARTILYYFRIKKSFNE
jgi:hypothetical protein